MGQLKKDLQTLFAWQSFTRKKLDQKLLPPVTSATTFIMFVFLYIQIL